MALIHEKLYQNDDLLIIFEEYVRGLIMSVSTMYGKDKKPLININIPDYKFDIDIPIPIGLIIFIFMLEKLYSFLFKNYRLFNCEFF